MSNRKLLLVPVDRLTRRVGDMYEVPPDRESFRYWHSHVRYSHAPCQVFVMTTEARSGFPCEVIPYVGTYYLGELER